MDRKKWALLVNVDICGRMFIARKCGHLREDVHCSKGQGFLKNNTLATIFIKPIGREIIENFVI